MSEFLYTPNKWGIYFFLILLFIGCDNTKKLDQLRDPVAQEISDIRKKIFAPNISIFTDPVWPTLLQEGLQRTNKLIKHHPDSASSFQLRSEIYAHLGKPYESLADLEKSNQIDPSGGAKFKVCLERDELPNAKKNTEQSINCYKEAMRLFEKSLKYPEKDINYVFAGLLSGNKKAMGQFEALVTADRKSGDILVTYEAIAQEYFGKTLDELFPPKNKVKK